MRILRLSEVRPGDVLAADLREPNGQVLLREGLALTARHVEFLMRRGYASVPVEVPGFEGLRPALWVDHALVQATIAFLRGLPPRFDLRAAQAARDLADRLLEGLEERPGAALELIQPLAPGIEPELVAANRALVVAAVGREHIPPARLVDVVVAALLLDAGEGNALRTRRVDDPEDPAQAEHQSAAAYAYLSEVANLSAFTTATIRQVRARWDGTGVPPLKGAEIWPPAQLLAPADKLARLLVATPQHPALSPHEALEWLMGGAGREYGRHWLVAIQRRVAPYGVGTVVRLSTGQDAVVVQVEGSAPARPRVRLLSGPAAGVLWDLADRVHRNVAILGPQPGREVPVVAPEGAATSR